METTRRRLLGAAALLAVLPVAAACSTEADPPPSSGHPLPIPPLRIPDADGAISLTAGAGAAVYRAGTSTPTLGYDGEQLGPTLLLRRGETVAITVRNELEATTTAHWHGMEVPAVMDGGPHQPIEPGTSWTAEFTPDQPAATLWYHPHPHGETADQVYRGMAGMIILEADDEGAGLPREYGVDDIPVILQDRRIGEDGELLDAVVGTQHGVLGRTLAVNGIVGPTFTATRRLTRFRILNASPTRSYGIRREDGEQFSLIAGDGGLLDRPHALERVDLSPGERAEIVLELQPGGEITLISADPELGAVSDPDAYGALDSFEVLRVRASPDFRDDDSALPESLAEIPAVSAEDARTTRHFRLQGFQINGVAMNMSRLDFQAPPGEPELWQVVNLDPTPHNFHIHGARFQVLDIEGQDPPPELSGFKDTIYAPPQRTLRLLVRTPQHVDTENPFMFHCHLLFHEDSGMMGQFTIGHEGEAAPRAIQAPPARGGSGRRRVHDH